MYKKFVGFLFFSFFCNVLVNGASLESYFKKAAGKGNNHHIKNIDFIYLINLDRRPEKFADCLGQLTPYGITPYRFSAVNGWELPLDAFSDLGVKLSSSMNKKLKGSSYFAEDGGAPRHSMRLENIGQTYFAHCLSRGAIGCTLSHLSILQDAYDAGYNTIWIMEDDIELIKDPHLISGLIEKLDLLMAKGKWDILFTDKDTKNQEGRYVESSGFVHRPDVAPSDGEIVKIKRYLGEGFRRIGARYGSYSYIMRRSGMKKILDFYKTYKIFGPYDDFAIIPDLKMITVLDDVVSTHPKVISDNGVPNYLIQRE